MSLSSSSARPEPQAMWPLQSLSLSSWAQKYLRMLSERRTQVRQVVESKIETFSQKYQSEWQLLAIINKPLPLRVERLRSKKWKNNTGTPYIGMVIPEEYALAVITLMLHKNVGKQYRPLEICSMTDDELKDMFTNTLVRVSLENNPKIQYTVTCVNATSMVDYGLTTDSLITAQIETINQKYKWYHLDFSGIKAQTGVVSITGDDSGAAELPGMCIFVPTSLHTPGWTQHMRHGNEIAFPIGKDTHKAFLHMTLGFSGQEISTPDWERVYVAGDLHKSRNPRIDKSEEDAIPFRKARTLPRKRTKREQWQVLTHMDIMNTVGFLEWYMKLQQDNIDTPAQYQKWLENIDNRNLTSTCIQALNDAGFLTPNLAPDWSVWSGKLDKSLGFIPNGLQSFLDNHTESTDSIKILVKWSGNNQSALAWETFPQCHVEWIGDNLYIDMVRVFSVKIGEIIPKIKWKNYLREYIAYHIIDALRQKYRHDNANQYGSIDVRPTNMSLDPPTIMDIVRKINSACKKMSLNTKPLRIDTHGEFEWDADRDFMDALLRENQGADAIILNSNEFVRAFGNVNITELLPYGGYPFHFTWWDFRDIPQIYKNDSFDMIVSKRSTSHQDDADFYQWLSDTAKTLKAWWVYISDGIRQSYTRVLRLDSDKLELLEDSSFQLWIVCNLEYEVISIVIYKKSHDEERDLRVADFLRAELTPWYSLTEIEKDSKKAHINKQRNTVTTRNGVLAWYQYHRRNQARQYVRDQIGPENFDSRVHEIIDESIHGSLWSASMIVRILVHLSVKNAQSPPDIAKITAHIQRLVDRSIKAHDGKLLPLKSAMAILEAPLERSQVWWKGRRKPETLRMKWG